MTESYKDDEIERLNHLLHDATTKIANGAFLNGLMRGMLSQIKAGHVNTKELDFSQIDKHIDLIYYEGRNVRN